MAEHPTLLSCPCEGRHLTLVFDYQSPPKGEVRFQFSEGTSYHRQVSRCLLCGHFISSHQMAVDELYASEYVNSTYGDHGIKRAFERIIGLDPAKSDNVGRVATLVDFAKQHRDLSSSPEVLDVGSGLCVFLHRLKQVTGWIGVALDPDQRAATHAREMVGVRAICADFMQADELGVYDIITFNKVLEHVVDPVMMLKRAQRFLKPHGFVYIEVPDGEVACRDGQEREEFFIEHHHVFSAASLSLLVERAGFCVKHLERLQEPSTKYTLRAFVVPQEG